MKKRTLLFIVMCLALAGTALAGSITESQARKIAAEFMNSHQMPAYTLQTAKKAPSMSAGSDKAAYYVFNASRGYVIVAGDDRAPAVLGYSDKGTFDAQDVPEAMQQLLDSYTAQIEALEWGAKAAPTLKSGAAIAPLVPCTWSQNNPFNILFPYVSAGKHAAVGCVATAMAQVMYYWKWPAHPSKLIPGYTSSSLKIEMPALPPVDFNWDAMQNTYQTTDTSSVEALAASQLSLYCAQAVQMDFKASSSGATTTQIPMYLAEYFDYKGSAHALSRINYTSQEWADTIYRELSEGRPVIFSGSKNPGGHAFICDGYDGNGMFHFNWGWNGDSNGFFLLNILNPEIQGTGSANGEYGYIYSQAILVGVEPGEAYNIFAMTITSVSLDSYVNTRESSEDDFQAIVTGLFHNYMSEVTAVRFGWGLYDEDGNLVKRLQGSYSTASTPGKYFTSNKTLNFGAGITSGTYRIVPICSEYEPTNWRPCNGADKNYIEVTINGNSCTFKGYGSASTPQYIVNSITTQGNLHNGHPVDLNVNLTNEGEWSMRILQMFVDGTFASGGTVCLDNGETADIPFSYTPSEPGTYNLTFSFNSDGSDPIGSYTLVIEEMPEASLTASIQILNITDATNKIVTSDKFSASYTIVNTGSTPYDEDLLLRLYKNTHDNYGNLVQAQSHHVNLAPGDTIVLQADFDNVVDGWRYFASVYCYSAGSVVKIKSSSFYTIVFPEAPQVMKGDVNNDGTVNITDVTTLTNYLMGNTSIPIDDVNADMSEDGTLNITDLTMLINMIMAQAE